MSETNLIEPIEPKTIEPIEPKTTEPSTQQKTEPAVDVTKVKSEAVNELLKTLGIESEDALKGMVQKAKEIEDANKTELQKKEEAILETTKRLVEAEEKRLEAEAGLYAVTLGVNKEMIEDLVIVAKAKVTKDKDIKAVIAEIKDSAKGKIYFSEPDETATKTKNITRKRVTKPTETTTPKGEEENTLHEGTVASRLYNMRRKPKTHYFN